MYFLDGNISIATLRVGHAASPLQITDSASLTYMSTVEDRHILYYIALHKPIHNLNNLFKQFCTVIHPLFLPRWVEGAHPLMISRHSQMHVRMFRLNFQRLVRGFFKCLSFQAASTKCNSTLNVRNREHFSLFGRHVA